MHLPLQLTTKKSIYILLLVSVTLLSAYIFRGFFRSTALPYVTKTLQANELKKIGQSEYASLNNPFEVLFAESSEETLECKLSGANAFSTRIGCTYSLDFSDVSMDDYSLVTTTNVDVDTIQSKLDYLGWQSQPVHNQIKLGDLFSGYEPKDFELYSISLSNKDESDAWCEITFSLTPKYAKNRFFCYKNYTYLGNPTL